ncbi:FtsX-like permease family protein [Clostridium sp. MSJ-8]|uniref:FtsX-like permease family protein n=1 Tax=Clostridium sp. MSJ-8 TaxID=2841510 RepID=UPI0034603E3A
MMLFKLSLKNIKKSLKDYAIYFFTLILGVAIFYVFNSLDSQTVMESVTASTREIIKLMTRIMSAVSVFVSFVLGFLIIYASRFLMKRRNKEFGIYLILGMGKRKVSLILFFETLIIGLLSLIVGLGIGIILSQLMSLLVVNMFEADMTNFTFAFSSAACMKTLIYFSIIYIVVMVFNTINVSRCKLIELLNYSKKSENVKLKNPIICTVVFIIAAIFLGYAYYMVSGGMQHLEKVSDIIKPIIIGSISTFFIFWSLSGLLIKIFMSMKKVYYKGLNSFVLRQVSSKINTTVLSMTVISIMLFITICILSSSLSVKSSLTKNMNELVPVDIELNKLCNISEDNGAKLAKDSRISIRETLENNGFNVDDNFKDIVDVDVYMVDDFSLSKFLGNKLDEVAKKNPTLIYDYPENIMKLSDYNKVAKLYGNKTYTLADNQYMVVADFKDMIDIRNEVLENNSSIDINGTKYEPKYPKCQYGFLDIASSHINTGIIILPDEALNNMTIYKKIMLANYKNSTTKGKEETEEKINKLMRNIYNKDSLIAQNTRLDIVNSSVGLRALVTFIGIYLGIIFLISSAEILALKELAESTDNKERYMMLRRIGVDEKVLNRALFKQIGIFFIFPVLVAIIHSIFGIKFSVAILEVVGIENLLPSIIMTAIFLIIIYGGYFLITYMCSKNIIKEK